jgi:thymidylate kinase
MVAIEGLDIVGKSTIARVLSEKDGWQYYRTPPPAYYEDCVKLGADGFPVYIEERFWLFMECLKYSSLEILRLLNNDISVAVDRWLWTTLSYHFAFNAGLEARWKEVANKEILALIHPQLSMLVHITDEEVYKRRKASRGILTTHDKMVVNNKKISDVILWNFKRLNPNFVLVDNSGNLKSTMDFVRKHVGAIEALK